MSTEDGKSAERRADLLRLEERLRAREEAVALPRTARRLAVRHRQDMGRDVVEETRAHLLASLAVVTGLLVAAIEAPAATPKPPIAGVTLTGQRLALADLSGKPVVINIWSSW